MRSHGTITEEVTFRGTERLGLVRTRLGDRAGTAGATALVLDQGLAPEAVDRQLAQRAAA